MLLQLSYVIVHSNASEIPVWLWFVFAPLWYEIRRERLENTSSARYADIKHYSNQFFPSSRAFR